MKKVEGEIQELVDRETRAWDTQDAVLLISILHPDMVWPWPPEENAHGHEWKLIMHTGLLNYGQHETN